MSHNFEEKRSWYDGVFKYTNSTVCLEDRVGRGVLGTKSEDADRDQITMNS